MSNASAAMDPLYANYTLPETGLMLALNFASTLPSLPILLRLASSSDKTFEAVISLALSLASALYHSCEALGRELYLSSLEWHRLDNVLAHTSIGMLFYELLNIRGRVRAVLNYCTLVAVLLAQEKYPWDLRFTVVPILCFFVAGCLAARRTRSQSLFNEPFQKGLAWFSLALFCFYKGLDEYSDYLRFYHSLWHFFAGVGAHYFYQIYTPYQSMPTILREFVKQD